MNDAPSVGQVRYVQFHRGAKVVARVTDVTIPESILEVEVLFSPIDDQVDTRHVIHFDQLGDHYLGAV